MKNLKISTIIVCVMLTTVLLSSCKNNEAKAQQRIHGKESSNYEGMSYQIIEVDGVEYITSYRGGICPVVKNTAK